MADTPSLADSRGFWRLCNALLILLHVAGVYAGLRYGTSAPATVLWLIVIAIHVLELPMAFIFLRARPVAPARVIIATLLFGFTWWIPTRRGIYGR